MKDNRDISSIQALDSYFEALLLDEVLFQFEDIDMILKSVADLNVTPTLRLQSRLINNSVESTGVSSMQAELDLSHVEKLFGQLKLDENMEVEIISEQKLVIDTDVMANKEVLVEIKTENTENAFMAYADEVIEPVKEVMASYPHVDTEIYVNDESEVQTKREIVSPWQNITTKDVFQVLFFESVGVTYAVPLAELGGIHRLKECNHLMGRPAWYLGLQTERNHQFDIVDTGKWMMAERITYDNHRDDYNYIVLLGDSKWGLACDVLQGTELLKIEQVQWRLQVGKRPWLTGLVKEKMCALLHVEALVTLLNQGVDAKALM
ncbi:chemotaxis protein CheW [Candidatus Enterovibrio escicola]|uniref:CheW domain protein n=1 Tax=Candidatus Enterovibrio escicola TaxID=1927127 RepID=A0A2A5T1G7_9GAMM|nr:chemotaxis protein CheW [Candidatus Enterovibrio escacola]PCS22009.1 CheW domain protein [Candidatus Enterovibrio escacola]